MQNAIEEALENNTNDIKKVNQITSAIEREEQEHVQIDVKQGQERHHKVPLNQFGTSIKENMIALDPKKHKDIHNSDYHKLLYPTDKTYEHYKESNIPEVNKRHNELQTKIQSFGGHQEVQQKHEELNAFEKNMLNATSILIKLNYDYKKNITICNRLRKEYNKDCKEACILCKTQNTCDNKKINLIQEYVEQYIKPDYIKRINDKRYYFNNNNNITIQNYNCHLKKAFATYYELDKEIIIYTKIVCETHQHCVADIWTRTRKSNR